MPRSKSDSIRAALDPDKFDNPSASDIETVWQNAMETVGFQYERVKVYETRRGLGFRLTVPIREWAQAHIETMLTEAEEAARKQASGTTPAVGTTPTNVQASWDEYQAFLKWAEMRRTQG